LASNSSSDNGSFLASSIGSSSSSFFTALGLHTIRTAHKVIQIQSLICTFVFQFVHKHSVPVLTLTHHHLTWCYIQADISLATVLSGTLIKTLLYQLRPQTKSHRRWGWCPQDFPLSAFCCILLQPPFCMLTNAQYWSVMETLCRYEYQHSSKQTGWWLEANMVADVCVCVGGGVCPQSFCVWPAINAPLYYLMRNNKMAV
jgi:hypothetical protein